MNASLFSVIVRRAAGGCWRTVFIIWVFFPLCCSSSSSISGVVNDARIDRSQSTLLSFTLASRLCFFFPSSWRGIHRNRQLFANSPCSRYVWCWSDNLVCNFRLVSSLLHIHRLCVSLRIVHAFFLLTCLPTSFTRLFGSCSLPLTVYNNLHACVGEADVARTAWSGWGKLKRV